MQRFRVTTSGLELKTLRNWNCISRFDCAKAIRIVRRSWQALSLIISRIGCVEYLRVPKEGLPCISTLCGAVD